MACSILIFYPTECTAYCHNSRLKKEIQPSILLSIHLVDLLVCNLLINSYVQMPISHHITCSELFSSTSPTTLSVGTSLFYKVFKHFVNIILENFIKLLGRKLMMIRLIGYNPKAININLFLLVNASS